MHVNPQQSVTLLRKLQALVYDILSPTIAIINYTIGLEKLSTIGQFFVGSSNDSKFAADYSDYIRRFFYNRPRCLRQHK